jgi:hypothetical protein
MADQNPMGRGADCPGPVDEDSRTEHSVLSLLIDEHPIRLTLDELALVLNAEPRLSDPEDAAERAVYRLVCMGLAYRDGRFLTPTRAALYFERLTKAHR